MQISDLSDYQFNFDFLNFRYGTDISMHLKRNDDLFFSFNKSSRWEQNYLKLEFLNKYCNIFQLYTTNNNPCILLAFHSFYSRPLDNDDCIYVLGAQRSLYLKQGVANLCNAAIKVEIWTIFHPSNNVLCHQKLQSTKEMIHWKL